MIWQIVRYLGRYKQPGVGNVLAAKSNNVDAAYLKQFEDAGYKVPALSELIMMKSQNLTMELIRNYSALGFSENIPLMVMANSMGATPAFIEEMKKKGHDLKSLRKYMMLKQALN